jgi:pimeloyl-ACP methyl ester carboxylesterase
MRWVGVACQISPAVSRFVITRQQDPAALFAAGRNGLPLLILNGRDDQGVNGEEVTKTVRSHFPHLEEVWFEGVGHMLSYE